jgi:hypothetical protein
MRVPEPVAVGSALAAATAELAGSELDDSVAALPRVLASLACGRFDRVQPLLHRARPAPSLPLIAGRYAAWTGDLATVAAAWPHVRASLERPRPADPVGIVLAAAGAIAVERVATDLGDPQLAAALIARSRAERARLHAESADAAARIAALAGLQPYAEEAAADGDAAWRILDFIGHTLGLDPDATRLRLALRPRLPAGAACLRVADIGFADATLSLSLEQNDNALACHLAQDSGAVPATVILELPLSREAGEIEIDGRPADLVPRAAGDHLVLSVQLVLDAPRRLTVRLNKEGPPT